MSGPARQAQLARHVSHKTQSRVLSPKILRKGLTLMKAHVVGISLASLLMSAAAFAASTDANTVVAPPPDWHAATLADLQEMHDRIEANTPGPVDPRNPQYKVWLKQGLIEAQKLAQSSTSKAQYVRALRLYANGFRDGHVQVGAKGDNALIWPGFLTILGDDNRTRVAAVGAGAPVEVGDELKGCDGLTADELTRQRVDRFRYNPDIPHSRASQSYRLFYTLADDPDLIKSCTFKHGDEERTVELQWHAVDDKTLSKAIDALPGGVTPSFGVRQVDGVWFVSVPSFNEPAATMQPLVDGVRSNIEALRQAPVVVIDVRGNGGGNSTWGSKLAATLWDEQSVDLIERSFDWTTDWRASRLNIDLTRANAAKAAAQGLAEDAAFRTKMADAMQHALERGVALATSPEPPTTRGLPEGTKSPFKGRVFLLTDTRCASACLDFADIVLRLPNVAHAGLPTSGDAVYIDVVERDFTSGLGGMAWPIKVYRNRVRGNNAYYTPRYRWPGGPMEDQAVAHWLSGLR